MKPSSIDKKKAAFLIIVFTLGFVVGLIINDNLHLKISFADFIKIVVDITLALIVTFYIGERLNKNSKILELRLEAIKNVEQILRDIHSEFNTTVMSSNQGQYQNLLKLFSNLMIHRKLFEKIISIQKNNNTFTDFKNNLDLYWEKILNPLAVQNFSGIDPESRLAIEDLYINITTYLFELKINIYK